MNDRSGTTGAEAFCPRVVEPARGRPTRRATWLILALVVVVAGCGGGDSGEDGQGSAASPVGPEVERGKELFAETVLGVEPGCSTCHALERDRVLVGPSLAGVGERAATQIPGLDAAEYLHESIVDPGAFVVEGFPPGRMPTTWSEQLEPEEIDALVAYLLTLR